jgi:hypothetical protein
MTDCRKRIWIVSSAVLRRFIGTTVEMVCPHASHVLMKDVTTTITDLVLLAVSSKANLLDSFVSLYAVFVGALHRIIGVEFGMSSPLPTIHLAQTYATRRSFPTYLDYAVQEPQLRTCSCSYDLRDSGRIQGIAKSPYTRCGALQCWCSRT